MTMTTWKVYGRRRGTGPRRGVIMFVDADNSIKGPHGDGIHFTIASEIARDVVWEVAEEVGTPIPDRMKYHVLFRTSAHFGKARWVELKDGELIPA